MSALPLTSPVHAEAIPLRRQRVVLGARLTRALEPLARQARDVDVGFSWRQRGGVPEEVSVDADKLTWAVTTLAQSALRRVPRGARLRARGNVAVDMSCEGEVLRIVVMDDGSPLSPASLEACRTGHDPEGSAPALLLIHEIVVAHGGHVEVGVPAPAFGAGTSVTLVIPMKRRDVRRP